MTRRAPERGAHDDPGGPVADPEGEAVQQAIAAVRRGDRDAYGRVVRTFERRLFGLTLMMTRDPTAAEEIAQDAFVRAFTHLDAYDDHRPFYPWLSTIAVRLAQNWLVRQARQVDRGAVEADPDQHAGPEERNPLAELITDEADRHLWRTVSALPSGERTVVILFYRQSMTVAECARALGVTGGTVKTLLFRARRRLRHALAGTFPDRSPT